MADKRAEQLTKSWKSDERWKGIVRPYKAEDVLALRGSLDIEYTIADMTSRKFWDLLRADGFVRSLGAQTGLQAVEMVQAGLKAIYVSGWQVAADANFAWQTYPDQSLYPGDSVPSLVRRINNAFQRADQIEHCKGESAIDWYAPIVADAEAGFGGILNVFELTKAMIESGAASVHFEDQLASVKKCGHMGGKVLVPTSEFIQKLVAARLASDVMNVPTILIARTDAFSANHITSDIDPRDHPYMTRERTLEGFYTIKGGKGGIEAAVARGLAFSPFSDMLWFETPSPNLEDARRFSQAIHAKFPGKLLAYNCSPSFNWEKNLDTEKIARFQNELGSMGYKYQFVTLAGFHAINHSMFRLAKDYSRRGMSAYSELQKSEFALKEEGYRATEHQAFVGTGYFDKVAQVISSGTSSTLATKGSTEEEQFGKS